MKQYSALLVSSFIILIMLTMVQDANALTLQAGPSGTPSSPIHYIPANSSNFIGPIQIEYGGTVGPWSKEVEYIPWDPNFNSTIIFMGQNLDVSGTTQWTGWHEEITTPDWIFLNDGQNNISVMVPGGPSNVHSITLAADSKSFWADFGPVSPGSSIIINFPLFYTGNPPVSAYPAFFALEAYPIASAAPIPEPSTIILLGAGLAGLVAWRKKRS